VPTSQESIFDNWYSIGLQGSGSNDVEVTDSFIPAHMIITAKDLSGGDFADRSTNPGPLFRPPVYMTFGILLTSTVIGMANAMVAEYLAQSRKAFTVMSGQEIRSFQTQQIKLGEATGALNAAQALIRADAREIQTFATTYQSPDSAKRSKYRSNAAHASGLAYCEAQRIFDLAGVRAIYTNNEINRIFLDIIVATRHVTQNVNINTPKHGRALLDMPLTNPSL
jgi:3-hydroxy-9,10-secoandrosta-1,3,5(10)-triene-9,17-dione monooxygenase